MRWEGREESSNVEDRRGMAMPAGGMALGGGLGSVVLLLIMVILGVNPQQLLQQDDPRGGVVRQAPLDPSRDPNAPIKSFVSVVMKDTEDVWNKLFRDVLRSRYEEPKLVLFTDQVRSACGVASSQVGPFYCPGDNNVYLDFSFFRQLKDELGAPGDFAMAYVIAHEVGHHVQNQLGISRQVQSRQSRLSTADSNKLSVRLELQADYLAGVWVYHAQVQKRILENGDREEALNAASKIGDDVLLRRAGHRINRDSFTHGTAAQRMHFLRKGIETGDVEAMMDVFEMSDSELDAINRR